MSTGIPPHLLRQLQMAQKAEMASDENAQYENFSASELYCGKCKRAMPVREKLLLSLPSGDMFDYICTGCGASLGTKK